MPEFAPEAPAATSFFSSINVLSPRMAASRAIPVPFTPPPMMITSNCAESGIVRSVRRNTGRLDVELPQLPLVQLPRRPRHQVHAFLRFWKWNHVSQRLGARQEHRQPVHPHRDAAVGRSTEVERIEEEAELVPRLLVFDPHRFENGGLHLGIMHSDRPPADLESIENHVVAITLHPARIRVQQCQVRVMRPRERVMRGHPSLELFVVLEQRWIDDPEKLPEPSGSMFRNVAELLAEVDA